MAEGKVGPGHLGICLLVVKLHQILKIWNFVSHSKPVSGVLTMPPDCCNTCNSVLKARTARAAVWNHTTCFVEFWQFRKCKCIQTQPSNSHCMQRKKLTLRSHQKSWAYPILALRHQKTQTLTLVPRCSQILSTKPRNCVILGEVTFAFHDSAKI